MPWLSARPNAAPLRSDFRPKFGTFGVNDPVPLPHLQFAVLGILSRGRQPGRQVRTELTEIGIKKTGPAFYRLMSRMEAAGLIEGWYEQEIVEGQIFRERVYKALPAGVSAWKESRSFYLSVIDRSGEEAEALA